MQLCTERAERIHLVVGSKHLCAERGEGRQKPPQPGLHGGELKCGVGSGGSGGRAVIFRGKVAGLGGAAGVCSGVGLEALAGRWQGIMERFLAAEQP